MKIFISLSTVSEEVERIKHNLVPQKEKTVHLFIADIRPGWPRVVVIVPPQVMGEDGPVIDPYTAKKLKKIKVPDLNTGKNENIEQSSDILAKNFMGFWYSLPNQDPDMVGYSIEEAGLTIKYVALPQQDYKKLIKAAEVLGKERENKIREAKAKKEAEEKAAREKYRRKEEARLRSLPKISPITAEKLIPATPNIINVFLTEDVGTIVLVIIPHQYREGQHNLYRINERHKQFLNKLKVPGWDWAPESIHYDYSHKRNPTLPAFYMSTPSQNTSHVYKAIEEKFEVREFNVSVNEWKEFIKSSSGNNLPNGSFGDYSPSGPSGVKEQHGRARYLWKHHSTKFNDWESKFVKSIGQQLGKGRTLSSKQQQALNKIMAKFKVPFDATASAVDFE